MMKKRILTIVAVLTMAITPAMAQVFLDDGDLNDGRLRTNPDEVGVMVPAQNVSNDQFVPVGEGLMILAGTGFVYLLAKRKKNE